MEPTILAGAIAFLFAALSAVAKIAWEERGRRCDAAEKKGELLERAVDILEAMARERAREDRRDG